jgi:hypothetical protein
MSKFINDELRQRAFERIAWVLKHFYDEQAEEFKDTGHPRLHSRVFEHLIFDEYIFLGISEAANEAIKQGRMPHREHVVPCAYIRDLAFKLYQEGRTTNEVASIVGRLLGIALITREESKEIDARYQSKMPKDWDYMTGNIKIRLDDVGIKLSSRD